MALNKAGLKSGIVTLLTEMRSKDEVSDDQYAERLATLIDDYVKTATIKYNTGLVAPSGGGIVTGTFTGNLE